MLLSLAYPPFGTCTELSKKRTFVAIFFFGYRHLTDWTALERVGMGIQVVRDPEEPQTLGDFVTDTGKFQVTYCQYSGAPCGC